VLLATLLSSGLFVSQTGKEARAPVVRTAGAQSRYSNFPAVRLACRHHLPTIKIGRVWRFRASELNAWVEQQFEKVK